MKKRKRKKKIVFPKPVRLEIYKKYQGHCAYCGTKLKYERMQVDHMHPRCKAHQQKGKDNNRLDNLMPSCQKCNGHKSGMMLEKWRKELGLQVKRLKKYAQFDRALRFGQVKVCEKPIVFYFESADGEKRS